MTCINCPMGCQLDVETLADGTLAKQEVTAPVRMVTGLVRVKGTKRPLCVKTKVAIPKGKIPDVLAALAATEVEAPVALGDVVIADACGTGIPVVATAPFAG